MVKFKLPTLNKTRKWIAGILVAGAVLLALPPILLPDPTDFLNIFIAKYLVNQFNFNFVFSLLLTFTILPLLVLYSSALVHPRDTSDMFSRSLIKSKGILEKGLKLAFRKPIPTVILLVVFGLVYWKFLL